MMKLLVLLVIHRKFHENDFNIEKNMKTACKMKRCVLN